MGIKASVGENGSNYADDTRYIQQLLNRQPAGKYTFGRIKVDGLVGPQTIGAIKDFQRNVVGMSYPDGRVDPGFQTIALLEKGAAASKGSPKFSEQEEEQNETRNLPYLRVNYRHGPRPQEGEYESEAHFMAPNTSLLIGGSIYPDDMNKYGRIKDGFYSLWLGFHGRQGGTPNEERHFSYKLRVEFQLQYW